MWRLNVQKSKLGKAAKIEPEILTIKQEAGNIEFHYDRDGKQSAETFVADKKDKVLREVLGGRILAKAYWKGATLTTETRAEVTISLQMGRYEFMKTKDAWTLSADGSLLTDKFTSEETQSLRVYERQK